MFDVDVWGNVAEWTGAISTGVAAMVAAITYAATVINNKYSQARLVHARYNTPSAEREPSITVFNDSGGRISALYILWIETTLAEFLLKNRRKTFPPRFDLPRAMTYIPENKPIVMWTAIPLKDIRNKNEFVGYRGRCGAQAGGTPRFLEPGAECEITLTQQDQQLGHTAYWVGFTDAKGRVWERAATAYDHEGLGELQKGRGLAQAIELTARKVQRAQERSMGKGANPLLKLPVCGRDPMRNAKYYAAVLYWLYRHRGESTSLALPGPGARPGPDEAALRDSSRAAPEAESPISAAAEQDDGEIP